MLAGEAEADGRGGSLAARGDLELAQDRRDVVGDGPLGEEQPLGYVRVAEALRDKLEHFQLAGGQVGGVLPCPGTGSARQSPGPTPAQTTSDGRRRGSSAQPL